MFRAFIISDSSDASNSATLRISCGFAILFIIEGSTIFFLSSEVELRVISVLVIPGDTALTYLPSSNAALSVKATTQALADTQSAEFGTPLKTA